ncbi:ACT domain-containing protein [Pseudonocardia spinosispora]|uniref:ACT domain-containing protein n=1 Tax=Pseudonocardia spinosispora TaxID=103441 RepID=UPI00042398CA|nr:ACT domain-containing protein [Pseudonocardia spinosispora]
MSFLIRVQVPDQPGMLGAIATALGHAGVDILGLDVVERAEDVAIDDLTVDLPNGRPPDVLITAVESIPGVHVESVRPHTGKLDTHRELELIEEISANPADGLQTFADGIPRIFRAGWALVVIQEDRRAYRLAESQASPETRAGSLPWLPLTKPIVLDPSVHWAPEPWFELDTELAAAPFASKDKALVVGRPGGPGFRPSELARLAHLGGIVSTILGL